MIQNPSKLSLFFSRVTSKINKKVKIAFALLLFVALGMFLYNAYQRAYKPYLYDKNNYYYKAYNYSVKKIIPRRKVVKDIEIEVLHFGKDYFPDNLSTYKVGHYIDKGIDPRRLLLHITFTDKTKIILPFGQVTSTENFFDRYERYFDRKVFEVGPGFDEEWFSNAENYRQMIRRFPGLHDKTMDADFELYLRDFLFMIVPGDTLYQTGAVDVGTNQLVWKLRQDERVRSMEQYNFRYAEPVDFTEGLPSFASIDVSFISLNLILPALAKILVDGGQVVALVKPQFEAGREQIGKNGIVRESSVHEKVLETVTAFAVDYGFSVKGLDFSPIQGGHGNIEFLAHLEKTNSPQNDAQTSIKEVVAQAHKEFKKNEEE